MIEAQEELIRSAIEKQKLNGALIAKGIWIQFKDGRNPPKVSPWGALLWNNNTVDGGNFFIPSPGSWWGLVRDYLKVSDSWLTSFTKGFDGEDTRDLEAEDLFAFNLGQRLAQEYLNQ